MAKLPLDLSKFKKVSSDGKSTTLKHSDGHSMTIAHAPLSPKFREQLAAIPIHKAEGGPVDDIDEAPKKNAEDMQRGLTNQHTIGEAWDNFKNGIGLGSNEPAPEPKKAQPRLGNGQGGYAKGGQVKMYADGSQDQPVSQDDSAPTLAPPPVQSPTGAPIVINVGQQPQIPPALINPNPGSQAAGYTPSNAQAPTLPGSQPFGTPDPNAAPASPQIEQSTTQMPKEGAPTPDKPAGQSDPYGTQAQIDAFAKGAGEYKAGLNQQMAAESEASRGSAAALQQSLVQQKTAQQTYQEHYNDLDKERKAFQSDLQNQHIDPQHYLNSQSTGQKIKTGIGLILGGIGAGILHQENPVLKYLNQQIQNDIVGNQMKEAAAKAGSAEAKGKMLVAAGKFDADNAALIGQMAMRKSLLTGMQAGQVDPSRVVMGLVPKEQQQAAYKELQEAQNTIKAKDNILSAFDQLQQLNTVGNRVTSPIQSSRQVSALRDPIVAGLSKETAGRFTEADAKMVGSLFPSAGDSEETILSKRAALNKLISEKMNFPMLQSYGIDITKSGGRFSPQGQSRIQERPPVTK